jgi:hypothetical protein
MPLFYGKYTADNGEQISLGVSVSANFDEGRRVLGEMIEICEKHVRKQSASRRYTALARCLNAHAIHQPSGVINQCIEAVANRWAT